MQCLECDTTAPPGARYCRRCGSALPGEGDDETTRRAFTARSSPERGWPRRRRSATTDGSSRAPAAPATPDEEDTVVLSVPVGTGEDAARRCPSCDAPNSRRRELCGRCGADLETGVTHPVATEPAAPATGDAPSGGREPRRGPPVWLLAVGLVALVAVIVLALSLAGFGPLGSTGTLPEAEFSEESYAGDAGALPLSDIATSSTRGARGGERFDATQMADDDPSTAWASDGSGLEHGEGETIDLFLAEPAWVERLVINNGFQSDAERYADHARIRRAELQFDGHERISIRLEDLGLQRQAIELPEPRLTTTVHLEITEAFPGDTSPDLAVSDVGLEGWVAEDDDLDIARERAERARAAPPTR